MLQYFAEFADYLNNNQGLLAILSVLFGLGGTLVIYKMPIRAWGFGLLVAAIAGTMFLIAGRYLIAYRSLYGFESVQVKVPETLVYVRRDSSITAEIERSYQGSEVKEQDRATCRRTEKAFDGNALNSASLSTQYHDKDAATLLRQYCPFIGRNYKEQAIFYRRFSYVLAKRVGIPVEEIKLEDLAWLGDRPLHLGPSIGGCRLDWSARNISFLEMYLAMPRPPGGSHCTKLGTFTIRLFVQAQNPNTAFVRADYVLMAESLWAPLRGRLPGKQTLVAEQPPVPPNQIQHSDPIVSGLAGAPDDTSNIWRRPPRE